MPLLPPNYHRQDEEDSCGLACAQMILDQIGAGMIEQGGSLAITLASIRAGIPKDVDFDFWATAPNQLAGMLDNFTPTTGVDFKFYRAQKNGLTPLKRSLAWLLYDRGIAYTALVFGDSHWLVVSKMTTTTTPHSAADRSFSVKDVEIKDPWVPTRWVNPGGTFVSAPPPPPHGASDDQCGAGEAYGDAYQHIAYHWWLTRYFTGLDEGVKKYIVICPTDALPTYTQTFTSPTFPKPFPRRIQINPMEAQQAAQQGIAYYQLSSRDPWATKLLGTTPGAPFLVEDPDEVWPDYYIVPMQRSLADIPVAIAVAAKNGAYQQAVAVEGEISLLPAALTNGGAVPQAAAARTKGSLLLPPRTREEVLERSQKSSRKFDLRNAILRPNLVWRPCRESFSPFWPFALLTLGQQRFYVRADGEVFTQLTLGERRQRGIRSRNQKTPNNGRRLK